ncbi:MAG: hypothetical protein H6Q33_4679, partial [Deltaproteobacteria bacterium]|nr:hypothetical protein [Deltaproteobacteria bacterium]
MHTATKSLTQRFADSSRSSRTTLLRAALSSLLCFSLVWAVAGADAATCPCSIWPATATPAVVAATNDGGAVELGVKFRASVAGTITGIRFYKGATNTGTHVGSLWTSTGTLLGQVAFTNETASGWQQATFASPVAITANTTYVASYHTNGGNYSYNLNYFASSGVTNDPLIALANGIDGGNGLYRYSSASAFPDRTWSSTNYWVDVVFTTTTAPDPTPPTVTAFTLPTTATSLTVPITSFTATDNVLVTGYLVTESATAP